MDEANIDVQVLSLPSALQDVDPVVAVPLARKINTELRARIIDRHPDRFAGFAVLPTSDPNAVAEELVRAVSDLGLAGAFITDRTQGRFLDDPQFDGVLACAAELHNGPGTR